ncbi:hypothetical protein COT93_02325 [Candidatus Falkowbacteria bacterium CG10_big_fil_rev_8_21_14_0_10_37_18]|uniref:Polymerase nucleotidyl transferase domain-containing protein n=1 Tax=Candidatus Falkowbacteria bacterium CG10_big_fil_rev_8_21_14_0_10_37_18 TaxID=1974562 RepID=A0A2H0V8M8_9BACT|nr:MAG: hypothetical protein COT93_02325 [Candidatus Falkowbacteria bacterium CG10_big_fil_rev_8_21_14_0_10_37_18]
MKINLLKLSNSLQADADALLKKTGLVNNLSEYGEVLIGGSYDLDLMIDGDIDLFVINKKINKQKSIDILQDLISQNDFNGYLYYDWTKRKRKGFPKGYYIGLKTDFRKRKWKVDVWLVKEIYKPTEKLMNFIKSNLNEKNKKIILDLKYKTKIRNLNLSSSDIYKKVLSEK